MRAIGYSSSRSWGLGAWQGPPWYGVFNLWGSADLLFAFYNGARLVRARKLQATLPHQGGGCGAQLATTP